MTDAHYRPDTPLPKSWPKHAKVATLHIISLAHFVLTHVRSFAVNSPIHRVRLAAERDRLDSEVALLREEIRIKDARMAALAPARRPHFSPTERMAILELMAARGWSKAEAGRRFLVIDDTIASWSGRIEEDEPGALVKSTVPVNKFPAFVAAMVIKLKTRFPMMGRRRIAGFLSRAGLHIAASTVRRMLNCKPAAQPPAPLASAENPDQPPSSAKPCTVIANYPNHVWGLNTTAVPTSAGFWTSWLPFSFAQSWPFCWWVAVVVDHWSRRSFGLAAFKRRPTGPEICLVLDEAARRAGRAPKYTVSDQGSEFGEDYLEWCDDHDVRARFGAVGRHGSIAVEERFIRTLKEEGLAHEMVSLQHSGFCSSLARFEGWHNEVRPHSSIADATPDEVFHRRRPANRRRRFEPRPRYPANSACASPGAEARSKIGARLELVATSFRGARHLAQVEIRRAN
jgi:transposase InsO family protein